jgi:hypothetical protein
MCLIVTDTNAGTVSLYDLDDVAAPLWMQFGSAGGCIFQGPNNFASVTMLNGRLVVGDNGDAGGCYVMNFTNDESRRYGTGGYQPHRGNIAERDSVGIGNAIGSGIVNGDVNDVAATVLEGAEIGALGLPIPTVAVASGGGVSVIHGGSGAVYDQTHTVASDNKSFACFWDDKGGLYWSTRDISSAGTYFLYQQNPLYADSSAITGVQLITSTASAVASAYPYFLGSAAPYVKAMASRGDNELAVGGATGLSLYKNNTGNFNEGMVSYHTSTYATGYQVGDIRFAGLAGNGTAGSQERDDRSVKGNDLSETGSVPSAVVATGAELYGYGPFSDSNHLAQANDADFDFTDGKFSVMGWVKVVASAAYQTIACRYSSADTGKGWFMYVDPAEKAYLQVAGASSVSSGLSGVLSEGWHFLVGVSDGSKVKIYADGVLANSATLAAGDLSNSAAKFCVGTDWDEVGYPMLGSLSLLRVSATVPSPQQIKEIYDAEKPLFAAGAKCLLQSDDGGSASKVNDLAYDKATGLLTVAQSTNTDEAQGIQRFRGLELVEQVDPTDSGWSYGSTAKVASSGGVSAYCRTNSGGGVLGDLPALDVRAELNEGESKIPDDGKFHFEGVTTNATPTVIANIPMGTNERFDIVARVSGSQYNNPATGFWINCEIKESYYWDGSAPASSASGDISKLTAEGTVGLDVDLTHNGTSDCIEVKVTGDASTRMVWKASVEVQRISEKTYER